MCMLTSFDAKFASSFACPPENSGYIKKDDAYEGCFSATDILSIAVVIRPVFAVLVMFRAVIRLFSQKVKCFAISSS